MVQVESRNVLRTFRNMYLLSLASVVTSDRLGSYRNAYIRRFSCVLRNDSYTLFRDATQTSSIGSNLRLIR